MEQRITKDTNEQVLVPAPALRKIDGDGLDWVKALRHPWVEVKRWGQRGYELGNWPDVVFALASFRDDNGALYGYCTYAEGEVTPRWYRSEAERDLAISEEAFAYWATWQAAGPPGLEGADPQDFRPVDEWCQPHTPINKGSADQVP